MRTAAYSWRLSRELKSDLERAARARKVRVSALLEMGMRKWLAKNADDVASDEAQKRLHAAAAPFLGAIRGGKRRRAENVSGIVEQILHRQYGR